MDLTTFAAALSLFTVITYGLVDRIKTLFPKLTGSQVGMISLLVGFVVPFVVAYSTFGHDVTLGSRTLNDVNVAGLLVLGALGAGGASVTNRVIGPAGAIANIGQNQPTVGSQPATGADDFSIGAG